MRKFILQNKVAIIAVALVMCLSASCVVVAQSEGTILDRIVMTYLNLKASEQGNVGEAEVGMNSMLIEDHFPYFRINDGMYTAKDITTTGDISTDDLAVGDDLTVSGEITALEKSEAVSVDNVLTASESGTVYYLSGAQATTTLPAVATATGTIFRFVISDAITEIVYIESAEGDNIEGSMIVAGAVVDCDAEDQINFIDDGENLGDYVELRSDGQHWFITLSNALTSSKLTCTDPS